MFHRAIAGTFTIAGLVATAPAIAQEASDTTTQRVCSEFAAAINTQLPGPALDEATVGIRGCEVSGPPIVAKMWSAAPNDPAVLTRLAYLAERLRDGRILDTLSALVRRVAVPAPVRIAALAVLTSYFSPSHGFLTIDGPARGTMGDRLSRRTHHDSLSGSVPLPANVRSVLALAFRDLANGDPEPTVRSAALYLRQATYYIAPSATPIDPNSIRLTYLCGNRFRLRNYNNIEVEVRYDVYGTSEARSLFPKARSTPPGYSELVFTAKNRGTVRVIYNQQLVQTKANGNKAC